jgi:hypothetical protein
MLTINTLETASNRFPLDVTSPMPDQVVGVYKPDVVAPKDVAQPSKEPSDRLKRKKRDDKQEQHAITPITCW